MTWVVLIGILFATAALFATPAKAVSLIPVCMDDPDFVYARGSPKAGGPIRNCDWIASLVPERKEKVCKRRQVVRDKESPIVGSLCPVACEQCDKYKTTCPKKIKNKADGSKRKCKQFLPGLTCDYNYEYFGGCGEEDPILCQAKDTYTCGVDGFWGKSSLEHFPCVGDIVPPSGEPCDPGACPLQEPGFSSECHEDQIGIDCDFGYTWWGCTEDTMTCSPSSFFTCTEQLTWIAAIVDPIDCGNTVPPPNFGEACDPTLICPETKPEGGTSCDKDSGLECPYEYRDISCEEDKENCQPTEFYTCDEDYGWIFAIADYICEGFDYPPDFLHECDPKQYPKQCPENPPGIMESCYNEGLQCNYGYNWIGCTEETMTCGPSSFYTCTSDGFWVGAHMDPIDCGNMIPPDKLWQSCDPAKVCPKETPEPGLPCDKENGLECPYDYRDISCDKDQEECAPTAFYTCDEKHGWLGAVADFICEGFDYPPGWLHECVPYQCPEQAPEIGGSCYNKGLECNYGYSWMGCTLEDAMCSPSSYYTCAEDGTWIAASVDPISCPGGPPGSPIGDKCDPSDCPLVFPPSNPKCNEEQVGAHCPYYEYVGCNFSDGFSCVETKGAFCSKNLDWELISMVPYICQDPEPDIPSGMTCEPCPKVEPADICPDEKPTDGKLCDIEGTTCNYDNVIQGCSTEELRCVSLSFFDCRGGIWMEGIGEPRVCEPDIEIPCPEEIPQSGSPCRMNGNTVNQRCDYDYRHVSCDENVENCASTKYYTCTDGEGWIGLHTDIKCSTYPDNFYSECLP
jgi:hypothetical protein